MIVEVHIVLPSRHRLLSSRSLTAGHTTQLSLESLLTRLSWCDRASLRYLCHRLLLTRLLSLSRSLIHIGKLLEALKLAPQTVLSLADGVLLGAFLRLLRLVLLTLLVFGSLGSQRLPRLLLLPSLDHIVIASTLHGHLKLVLGEGATHVLQGFVSIGEARVLLLNIPLGKLSIDLLISVLDLHKSLRIFFRNVLVEITIVLFSVLSLLLKLIIDEVVHFLLFSLLLTCRLASYSCLLFTRLLCLLSLGISSRLLLLLRFLLRGFLLNLGRLLLCESHLLGERHGARVLLIGADSCIIVAFTIMLSVFLVEDLGDRGLLLLRLRKRFFQ